MVSGALTRIIDALPLPVVAVGALAVVGAAALWATAVAARPPALFAAAVASDPTSAETLASDLGGAPGMPESVWIATLYDEFEPPQPKVVAAPPPPPPPKLDVQLKAILSAPEGWRAFVFVPAEGEYRTMAAGDRVGSATLRRVEARAAVFALGDREIRVEIDK